MQKLVLASHDLVAALADEVAIFVNFVRECLAIFAYLRRLSETLSHGFLMLLQHLMSLERQVLVLEKGLCRGTLGRVHG